MIRIVALAASALILSGCRAPMPSMNLLAPYGTPRIAPPNTGSYGSPTPYYQPPPATAPAVGTGLQRPTGGTPGWTQTQGQSSAQVVRPLNTAAVDANVNGGVQPANFQQEVLPASEARNKAEPPVRIGSPGASDSETRPRLQGMPVNDATRPREPAPFRPPAEAIDISQLPRAAASTPLATRSLMVTPPNQLRAGPGSFAADAATAASGWRTRSLGAASPRVAGR